MFTLRSIPMARSIAGSTVSRAIIPTVARTYATNTENTKPPVPLYGLDGTYASALYTAAAKNSSLDQIDRTLKSLKTVMDKDSKLMGIVSSPTLSAEDKKSVVNELVKQAGSSAKDDKAFRNLLEVLADNNRLFLLDGVIEKFSTLMGAHRGEVEATITSAQPLDNRTISRLESAISKSSFVQQGQKLKVNNKVNPEVLGGLVVEVGDRTIDLSVSAKIAKLNKLLTDTL